MKAEIHKSRPPLRSIVDKRAQAERAALLAKEGILIAEFHRLKAERVVADRERRRDDVERLSTRINALKLGSMSLSAAIGGARDRMLGIGPKARPQSVPANATRMSGLLTIDSDEPFKIANQRLAELRRTRTKTLHQNQNGGPR